MNEFLTDTIGLALILISAYFLAKKENQIINFILYMVFALLGLYLIEITI